ncbi:MAG: YlxM family DNA-binding protein [Peptococcaceae bacterium]|nr:YlxM family DNA-binding protein [Peptococcaceae bacterium]
MSFSMDYRNRMICLFDCYGDLLTDKQKMLFQYYFDEDLSLAEISDLVGTSRQAVHNSITRCEETLENFEKTLGVFQRSSELDKILDNAITAIENGLATGEWSSDQFEKILTQLKLTRKAD